MIMITLAVNAYHFSLRRLKTSSYTQEYTLYLLDAYVGGKPAQVRIFQHNKLSANARPTYMAHDFCKYTESSRSTTLVLKRMKN